ncbi:P80 family lipoprotein, partial [Mycoplasmopsis synoviae]
KVSYNSLSTTGSPAQVAARTVYNKLKDAAGSGAVVLQPLGQYSSGKQIYHNFALSIGSTAGYLYNFIDDTAASALRFTFDRSLDKFSFDDNDNPAASNYN